MDCYVAEFKRRFEKVLIDKMSNGTASDVERRLFKRINEMRDVVRTKKVNGNYLPSNTLQRHKKELRLLTGGSVGNDVLNYKFYSNGRKRKGVMGNEGRQLTPYEVLDGATRPKNYKDKKKRLQNKLFFQKLQELKTLL